uniref:Uncharacterized protein n=1 Tax=Candidatus Kentrum sp. LFY TaxID=2126342 RepID=A0A450USD8_9GAMM|nr:MAG: hypothetical protein BECKLFY1418B_GA0070995_10706 [Candidatus Kentron sp. LFY]
MHEMWNDQSHPQRKRSRKIRLSRMRSTASCRAGTGIGRIAQCSSGLDGWCSLGGIDCRSGGCHYWGNPRWLDWKGSKGSRMMSLDSTAVVIIVALIGAAIFLAVEFLWKRDTDVIKSVGIALAIYGTYMGYQLIESALDGDSNNLPGTWREYLGIAGIVIIGLSFQYIIRSFRKITEKSGNERIDDDKE